MKLAIHTFMILSLIVLAGAGAPPAIAQDGQEGRHLFILSGQSNMRNPLPQAFQHCVEQVFGEDRVIVVTVARPSQPIKQWYKDWTPPPGMVDENPETNGQFYDQLLASVQRAIRNRQIDTVTYIWMQGEADAGTAWGSVYEQSFLGVLDQFKRDLEIDQINFVVGRINDYWLDPERHPDGELIREIQQSLGEDHDHGRWINTDDLNRGVNPWGGYSYDDGHFPPPGYRVMGQRFAEQACRLIDPDRELDPAIFQEHFFDEASDVTRHAAIGKKVQAPPAAPDHAGGDAGLAVLLDGKFAPADHTDPGWIGFAPSETPLVFIIDLGQATPIQAVGLNTLLSSPANAEFPDRISFSFSDDGETYTQPTNRYNNVSFTDRHLLGRMRHAGIEPQPLLILNDQENRPSRYLKIQIETGDQWLFIDEIIINPE